MKVKYFLIFWLISGLCYGVSLEDILKSDMSETPEIAKENVDLDKTKYQSVLLFANSLPHINVNYNKFSPISSNIIAGNVNSGFPVGLLIGQRREVLSFEATMNVAFYKQIPQIKQGLSAIKQHKINVNQNKQNFKFEVTQVFLKLLEAKKVLNIIQTQLKIAEMLLQIEEIKYKNGTYSLASDLDNAKANYLVLKNQEENVLKDIKNAELAYANKIGVLHTEITQPDLANYPIPFDTLDDFITKVKSTNPDLLAANYYTKQQTQNKIAKIADMLPDLNISAAHNRIYNNNNIGLISYAQNSVSLTASMPIFSGGSKVAAINIARNDEKIAKLNEQIIDKQIQETAFNLWYSAQNTLSRIETQKQILKANKTLHEISLVEYKSGKKSITDFMVVEKNLLSAELDMLLLQNAYILNIFQIKLISGLTI